MHLSAIFENIPIGTISWNSWKLIRFLLKQDVQCLRPDYSLFPYAFFLGLKHSPIKIFKLKFIFGIWSCSVGHKILFSIGLNDCLSGFICPRRLLQVINLYIYLGTAGNRTVNTMPNIQHLITTWQFEDHVTQNYVTWWSCRMFQIDRIELGSYFFETKWQLLRNLSPCIIFKES